jgi:hypothetical protein
MSRRSLALLIAFGVFLLLAILSLYHPVEARQAASPNGQEGTDYPALQTLLATLFPPYPGAETATTAPTSLGITPSATSALQISPAASEVTPTLAATPVFVFSPTAPVTPGRDLFGTENAEMSGARVTPPASETPVPTLTLTPTITPSATLTAKEAFTFNRAWFIAGIFIPVGLLLVGWLVVRASKSGEFG